MSNRIGRPHKYQGLLNSLDPSAIYTASMIADIGMNGMLQAECPNTEGLPKKEWLFLIRRRARIALGRFVRMYNFPREGDGLVRIKGQANLWGWTGKRWATRNGRVQDRYALTTDKTKV